MNVLIYIKCIALWILLFTITPPVISANEAQPEKRPLVEVLKEICEKHQVVITYDVNMLSDIKIEIADEEIADLNLAIEKVISQTNLDYKYLGTKYYVIYKDTRKGKKSMRKIKRKLNQISSIESSGAVSLGISSPDKKDKTLSLVNALNSFYDAITVSGTVTDSEGQPLIGVNVLVKGTTNGTSTDFDGNFTLNNVEEDAKLVFSYIGYQTQEITLEGQELVNVEMVTDAQTLDELVVVGYGTVKKSDLTGSVQRIDGEDFKNQNPTQIGEMLTGTIAGFNASQNPSAEGGSSLEVRGPTSLNAETEPLIVLDGVIFNGNLADISPNDIESIDVLKDASSTAIYGSRAASGVIIITTKQGISGKPTISFTTDLGFSEVTNTDIRPLNGEEYTNFRRDLLITENPNQPNYYYHNPEDLPSTISTEEWYNLNDNPNADITTEWLNRLLFFPTEVENYLEGNSIDWIDRTIQKGMRQNYDLSINGGTDRISYYWSMGYTNNEGVIVGDQFKTLRTRLNVNAKITDFLDAGINAQFSNRNQDAIQANLGQVFRSSPFSSFYEEDGTVKWFPNDYSGFTNPLINTLLQHRNAKINSIFSSIYANVKLPFEINYKLSFQPRFSYLNNYNFWPSSTPTGSDVQGRGTRREAKTYEWMVDNLLSWNKSFGVHSFDITFLYNLEKFQQWQSDQTGEGFAPNENLSYNALQFATNQVLSNSDDYSTGDALMGRLNYTLDDKYLFTFSIRRDGYSAFGQGNPRAVFPAGAFAWKISNEGFFSGIDFFNQLKLRLSWGVNGNREIGRYAALARLAQNIYSNGSRVLVGVFNNSLANPSLAWERTEAFNVGIDFGIMEGRISGSVDLYDMTTNDLLMERILPRITGFDNVTTNLGELQNRGFELTLNSFNVDNSNFKWNSDLVFSLNRNKIIHLFGDYEEVEINGEIVRREISDISNGWFIGQAIDRIWDYNMIGIWQTDESDEAEKYGLNPGDYKAEDVNGDGTYSQLEDKQFIGYRQPRYRIGLRNNFTFFQNFSASIFIRSDLGHMGNINDFEHTTSNLYDRLGMRNIPYWTEANPSNEYGSLTVTSGAYGGGYNVYFDRSFIRIQDLSLSYQVPNTAIQRLNLQSLRIYTSIRNIYSFDKWEYWDPESGNNPMPRIYTLGLNLSL